MNNFSGFSKQVCKGQCICVVCIGTVSRMDLATTGDIKTSTRPRLAFNEGI